MNYRTAEERYNSDPLFKSLVDMMYMHIGDLKLTPTELREAAMFACIKFEHYNIRPMVFGPTGNRANEILKNDKQPDCDCGAGNDAYLALHHSQCALAKYAKTPISERRD